MSPSAGGGELLVLALCPSRDQESRTLCLTLLNTTVLDTSATRAGCTRAWPLERAETWRRVL